MDLQPKRRPASAYATATHAAALGLQPKEVTECRRRAKETAQRRCASASGVRSRKVLISLTPEPSTDSLADGTPFNEACARLEASGACP